MTFAEILATRGAEAGLEFTDRQLEPVSYTHLTLPTNSRV